MHVFGPAARYPWSPARGYTPADALLEDYAAVQARLGLERVVVVQPSVYGTDNRCTRDAVVRLGPRGRGVAVLPAEVSRAELARLDADGFRGARLNLVSAGGVPLDALDLLARKVAAHGWHLQLFAGPDLLPAHAARLAALPVDLVFDHFGPLDRAKGVRAAGDAGAARPARARPGLGKDLGRLPGRSRRLALAGRKAARKAAAAGGAGPAGLGHRLAAPRPFRPHARCRRPARRALGLVRDEALYRKILVDNPARLYGFA